MKQFEDLYSEIQTDMIDICMEYVEDKAEKIFLYCSCEDNMIEGNVFYKINGKVVMKHKLNEAVMGNQMYDVSISRQKEVIEAINDDIKKLMEVCKEYNQEMPTQIKIIYDIKKNSLNAQAGYKLYFSKSRKKTANDAFEKWFKEICKAELN